MSAMASQITGVREFPAQRVSNAEMLPFDDVIMHIWPYFVHGIQYSLGQFDWPDRGE